MDTKFQTSFIPKKPVLDSPGRLSPSSVSVFLIVAIIIFIVTLSAAGGLYIYRKTLLGRIDTANKLLVKAKNSFESSLIDSVKVLNRRIEAAKQLVTAHTALSPIFDVLEKETLATVRFDSLNYELKDSGGVLRLGGQGKNFNSVALQSDIFGKDKSFKSPVFSDLNPDLGGNIVFKFSATIDPKLTAYANAYKPRAQAQ